MQTNSIGIELREIQPGTFQMGGIKNEGRDETPLHRVHLTQHFRIGAEPVTNRQFEAFAPWHRMFRGMQSVSAGDGEAAVFVSWSDASAFCRWLSGKEGKHYRLPTEAEWEYCCRAGTETPYSTGETLAPEYCLAQTDKRELEKVNLLPGKLPENAFGLRAMHGCVEEWCSDWYGPYSAAEQSDPVGPKDGEFRIARGGSHNTDVSFLTSSRRFAALPEERNCFLGFRVVQAEEPAGSALPRFVPEKEWNRAVSQVPAEWHAEKNPVFSDPVPYINVPENPETIPLYHHNHCPSITWCDNGDLLAIWFSCEAESGREMTILASRLRRGSTRWDTPAEFFKVPGRNMSASAVFNDGRGKLYHFNGVSAGYDWVRLAASVRTSTDCGVTWSKPEYMDPWHIPGNQVISGTFRTKNGLIVQPADATPLGDGGTALHISADDGKTWYKPASDTYTPRFENGGMGTVIAGIHAGVAELSDGSLLALGRGDTIDGKMPMSISHNLGVTWNYSPSPFPPIANGQRLILKRLSEGPLLLVSFTDNTAYKFEPGKQPEWKGMRMPNAFGTTETVFGMYAAVSYDDGKTWPVMRLLSTGEAKELNGGGWTGSFRTDENHAEPMGYLAATQSPDGMIHLISSKLYYRFNLAWLEEFNNK